MKNNHKVLLLIIIFIIQIAVAFSLIVKRENTLKNGSEYKFSTTSLDPFSPLAGRYLYLNFKDTVVELQNKKVIKPEDMPPYLYVILKKDASGFAIYDYAAFTKPQNVDYIKVENPYFDGSKIQFSLPFNRYYIEEKYAFKLEKLYSQNANNSYLTVKLQDGFYVPEKLYINDKKIEDYFQ